MPYPDTLTKTELLAELRESGATAATGLRTTDPASFDTGRYENGWNGREILAHLASIEWTYPRLLEIPASAPPPAASGSPPAAEARGGIDGYNQRQVAKRSAVPVAELIEEFERNRARTIAAVEAAPDDLLAREVRSAGGRTGSLLKVFYEVAVGHVRGHTADILG